MSNQKLAHKILNFKEAIEEICDLFEGGAKAVITLKAEIVNTKGFRLIKMGQSLSRYCCYRIGYDKESKAKVVLISSGGLITLTPFINKELQRRKTG